METALGASGEVKDPSRPSAPLIIAMAFIASLHLSSKSSRKETLGPPRTRVADRGTASPSSAHVFGQSF